MLKIFLSLLQNKWFWVVILAMALISFVWNLYSENQQLKFEKSKSEQNAAASKDELTKSRDSLQSLSSYVGDLNQKNNSLSDENKKVKNEYRALKVRYDIAIDSISILNQKVNGHMVGDSLAIVQFVGKKNIVTYDGQTQINIRTKESNLDYLNLSFEPIDVRSELYLDEIDNIWKMKTISMTSGVKLRGISTIDEETFKKMKGVPSSKDISQIFGVGSIFGTNFLAPGFQLKPNNWEFGVHYILLDNTKMLDKWYDKLLISIHYYLF